MHYALDHGISNPLKLTTSSFLILVFVFVSFTSYALAADSAATPEQTCRLTPEILYEFPSAISGSNIAQTKHDTILVTTQGGPYVFEIDCNRKKEGVSGNNASTSRLIATLHGHENTFGIVELEDNVFYVNAGNYSAAPLWQGIVGSNAIYKLNMSEVARGAKPRTEVSLVTPIPPALTLDGMSVLSKKRGTIILGDTQSGILYVVDTRNSSYQAVYQNDLFNETAATPSELDHVGINGISIQNQTLYYTNTARHSFGRAPITVDGVPTTPIEVLDRNLTYPDDFAINSKVAVLTQLPYGLFVYGLNGLSSNSGNSSQPRLTVEFPGANTARFGRADLDQESILYALYNKKIINKTGSGVMRIDTRKADLSEWY